MIDTPSLFLYLRDSFEEEKTIKRGPSLFLSTNKKNPTFRDTTLNQNFFDNLRDLLGIK